MVTFLATGLTLAAALWLQLSLLARIFEETVDAEVLFLLGSFSFLIALLLRWRSFSIPWWHSPVNVHDELVPLFATALVVLGTVPVLLANGWQGGQFILRGFFHGDTTTFVSLTQRSLLEDGLVSQNVFAGNGSLEYPTLLHAGMADFLTATGNTDVLIVLPWLTIIGVLITVPVFWLLWDAIMPSQKKNEPWLGLRSLLMPILLQFAAPMYVLTMSWDRYIYPQTHFFLTGMFVVLASLLYSHARSVGPKQYVALCAATIITFVLMLSNAVTGTAAMVVLLAYLGMGMLDNGKSLQARVVGLVVSTLLLLVFIVATPGQGAISLVPGLSYTAANDMLRLLGPLLLVVAGLLTNAQRREFLVTSIGGLSILAFIAYIFSSRDIVVANSSRFFYHAILIGFPLAVFPLVRMSFWLKQQLLHSSQSLVSRMGSWGVVVAVILLGLLPGLTGGAVAYDNLLFGETTVVVQDQAAALAWIADNTAASDIFVASPDSPWLIPLFTGRALLRTNYWLDAKDSVTEEVNRAFAGDVTAQAGVIAKAQYLVLPTEDLGRWSNQGGSAVFSNEALTIFSL